MQRLLPAEGQRVGEAAGGRKAMTDYHVRGEEHGRCILTQENVIAIRQSYLSGCYSFRDLAVEYGVTKPTIEAILRGHNWSHLLTVGEVERLRQVRASRVVVKRRREPSWSK